MMSPSDPPGAYLDPPAGTPGQPPGRSDPPAEREATFEEMMEQLETLTARLAAGDVGIEATAELYERAERLHAQAKERLDQVRARVEGLVSPANTPSGASPSSGRLSGEDGGQRGA